MTYAIIGSGNLGAALARRFARSGIAVTIANTRNPDSTIALASDPDADLAIWTMKMTPGTAWQLPPASRSDTRRQLFFFSGSSLTLDGEVVDVGSAIEVDSSVPVELANGAEEAEILLLQARPIGEPIVQHGPFVMNTLDEIRRAYADYQNTQFGGWNWPTNGPNHGPEKGGFASS